MPKQVMGDVGAVSKPMPACDNASTVVDGTICAIFCFFAFVFFPSIVQAQSCDAESVKSALASFLDGARAKNCAKYLHGVNASKYWVRTCKQLTEGLGAEMHTEFSRRTQLSVSSIKPKDGNYYAILRFVGPESFSFIFALKREGFCLPKEAGVWPEYPGATGCGEEFWRQIPIVEYSGAVQIDCRNGQWAVLDPESTEATNLCGNNQKC